MKYHIAQNMNRVDELDFNQNEVKLTSFLGNRTFYQFSAV